MMEGIDLREFRLQAGVELILSAYRNRPELFRKRTDTYDPATLAAAQDARDEGLAERETGRKTA